MRFPWYSRNSADWLESPNGRIMCPLVGDADIDRCIGCPMLHDVRYKGEVVSISCRPTMSRHESTADPSAGDHPFVGRRRLNLRA